MARNRSIDTCALLCVAVGLGSVTGCDKGTPVEPEGPTLVEVQEQVFTPSCGVVGCHAGGNAAEGLVLSAGSTYENTVGVPSTQVPSLMRVEPGDASESYLFIKITGGDRMATGTFHMPIGGELTGEQIALVEGWIEAGAER